MSPKPRRRVKQPEKKKLRQKQKQKQQQNVRVNITQTGGGASGGGGGGGSFPVFIPQPIPQQFRDTSGENVKLMGLVKNLENKIANFKLPVAPVATEPAPNPSNDAATQTAVFNAPITYNDDLAEEVIREINQLNIKPKPIAEPPAVFNAPNENNASLMERIRKVEKGYEESNAEAQAFKTPARPRAESAPNIGESSANPFTGTPAEPYINRNGKWRSDVKRGDLERLAQDYGLPVTGQLDENGREVKLTKEQLKNILNVRLGL